ncbi:MAG: hypothetical protein U0230_28470 [Polyangiales bacterium]
MGRTRSNRKKRPRTPVSGAARRPPPRLSVSGRAKPFDLAPLSRFDPTLLIRDQQDELGQVVLSLALWFNDLKDVLLAWETLAEAVALPDTPAIDAVAGQAVGIRFHILRLGAGLLHELLEVLRTKANLLEAPEFQAALSTLHPESLAAWNVLSRHAIARTANGHEPAFRSVVARMRNKLIFHYVDPADLVVGYRSHFAQGASEPHRHHAYWSLGTNAESSRFFFADAAVQAAFTGLHSDASRRELVDSLRHANEAVRMVVEAFVATRSASNACTTNVPCNPDASG